MSEEATYTLAEARELVERQQIEEACQARMHRPSINRSTDSFGVGAWLCDCDRFIYYPQERQPRPASMGVDWRGEVFPVNANPAVDTWNGQPIPGRSSELGKTFRHVQTGVLGRVEAMEGTEAGMYLTVAPIDELTLVRPSPFPLVADVTYWDGGDSPFLHQAVNRQYFGTLRVQGYQFHAQWAEVL